MANPDNNPASPATQLDDEPASSNGRALPMPVAEHHTGFGIFKPGQGYWVRVLTAAAMALLFLATAAWVSSQLELVRLPEPRAQVTIVGVTGEAKPNAALSLEFAPRDKPDAAPVQIGTATIEAVTKGDAGQTIVTIGTITTETGRSFRDATAVQSADGSFSGRVARAEGIPVFDKLYLKAGAAAVILLAGAIITYLVCGVRRRSVDFLVATDGEMKKVNWSTRKQIFDSTVVVVAACFLISSFLFLIDIAFRWFFQLIGVIQH